MKIDFELSRVKLQRKVPEGKLKSLRVIGVLSYRVKIPVNVLGKFKGNQFCFELAGNSS